MKPWQLILISVIIGFGGETFSQDLSFARSSRSSGIGDASVALVDLWSINNNQAGLSEITNSTVGISVSNNFSLAQLTNSCLAYALPTTSGTLGFSISNFGYRLYRENRYTIAFGKKLNNKISAGIQLNYFTTQIFGSSDRPRSAVVEGGMMIKLSKDLTFGSHFFNPFYRQISTNQRLSLPAIIRLGCRYSFSDKIISYWEVEKSIRSKHNIKTGLTYQPNKTFRFSTGISTQPTQLAFGFGVDFDHIHLDFSIVQHQVLGASPLLSPYYEF